MTALKLIVGLGNPGSRYDGTPHNVGAEFVRWLAERCSTSLSGQSKFKSEIGSVNLFGQAVRLAVPTTYMNLSGQAVGSIANFYRLAPEEILVACDEMAFEPGVIKLKKGGGANGHNGLRDIISSLGNKKDFHRLRIGVGHPGDRNRVSGFLTDVRMPAAIREQIARAYQMPDEVLQPLVRGDMAKAMNLLHAPADETPGTE